MVLGWHEHLQQTEIPPEYMWEDSEGLELWWASVEDKRSDGEQSSDASQRTEPVPAASDDSGDGDQDQPPGMAENEYAKFLKRS